MTRLRLLTLTLAAAAAAALLSLPSLGPSPAPASYDRSNVIVIMTDDQTYSDMVAMPQTRRLIGDAGARFTRAYVSYPICCPSRATFFTGQYAHNHGVRTNTPPDGGVEALDEDHVLPVWLREARYDTIHIGKYLNGYGLRRRPGVPRGWTDWQGAVDKSTYQMYGYTLNENGVLKTYGEFDVEEPSLYQTDVLRDKALATIREHEDDDARPFFLSLAFVAPHGEVVEPGSTTKPYVRPAPRHVGRFGHLRRPRGSFDERDVSDKPPYVRRLRRVGRTARARILQDFRARRESLLAVDEAVAEIVAELQRTGQLDDTYLIFTSDNGFFHGEHRIPKGKYLAYEPSTHVPLMVRGPGIPAGTVSGEPIPNTDLAPTVLDMAGATADRPLDGRSLLPFARDGALRTRRPVLHEGLVPGSTDRDGAREALRAQSRRGRGAGVYFGIRTPRFLYVKWRGGARELYDLAVDPHELHSLHRDPRYAALEDILSDEVARLRRCAGEECLRPLPPLPAPRALRGR